MDRVYIIAIDQSTQGTKAMLIDNTGRVAAKEVISHRQIVNDKGWVEHDGEEIIRNLYTAVRLLVENSPIDKSRIVGVGIANQRETVAVWERNTGKPIHNAIVWQCNRAADICNRIEREGRAAYISKTTGLRLSPFFSGPKIAWILENVPGAFERASRGELCCGTMDSWVIFNLTGGKHHKTDCSNASRMQLLNLEKIQWDEKTCDIFHIPMNCLPEICDSDALFGETNFNGLFDRPLLIHAAIGDSHAALFAHGCFESGMCMTGYGTGSCVMMNLGNRPILSRQGVLTSIAWKTNGEVRYAFDGVINYSGAVISWLINDLKLILAPNETDALSKEANPADTTYLVPAFTGIGAPHWSNEAKAVFCGMSRTTGKAELVRAALESIAFQIKDVVAAMQNDAEMEISVMRVGGGPTKNDYLMQFQSDILECPLQKPYNEEMTCLGVAYIAGLALGVYDRQSLNDNLQYKEYLPQMSVQIRNKKLAGWDQAIKLSLGH